MNESCHVRIRDFDDDVVDMEWLRLVGSLKMKVSFAEYRLFYRVLLQKRFIILRSLLIVATPYDDDALPEKGHVTKSKETNMLK